MTDNPSTQSNSGIQVDISANPNKENKKGGLFTNLINNFMETLNKEIKDISNVEIVTAIGDPKTDVNPDAELMILGLKAEEVRIVARTRIELDGDIMVLLPNEVNGDFKINKEIMAIHKENVDTAVKNWNDFMKNMLAGLDTLINITGLSKEKAFSNLST